MLARPQPRDERCCELATDDQAHNEGAKAKVLVHMKRQHWHRQTDDEERYENHAHDREQRGDRVLCSSLSVHAGNKVATGTSVDKMG